MPRPDDNRLLVLMFVSLIGSALAMGCSRDAAKPTTPRMDQQEAQQKSDELHESCRSFAAQGNIADAIEACEEGLELSEFVHGQVHSNVAADLVSLADLYRHQGDYFHAEPLIRRAIEIDTKLYGQDHPEVAVDLIYLARLQRLAGDKDQANETFIKGLDALRNLPELSMRYAPHLAQGLRSHGELLVELAQPEQGRTELFSSEQLYEQFDPEQAVTVLIQLVELSTQMGDYDAADVFKARLAELRAGS